MLRMSEERLNPVPQTQTLIEADLLDGGHRTFDYFVAELERRGKMGEDIFSLSNKRMVQIDLCLGCETTFRAHIYLSDDEKERMLDLWKININGNFISDVYSLMTENKKRKTFIYGSSSKGVEGGDVRIETSQLAGYIDQALNNLTSYN